MNAKRAFMTVFALFGAACLAEGKGPSQEEMLKQATFTLSEAIDKGLKEAKTGVVVKAEIEEEKGQIIYTMDIAQGDKILEVGFDVKTGKLAEKDVEDEDQSKLVKAAKVTASQAIAVALKKAPGKAVAVELKLNAGSPEIEVDILSGGKLTAVTVDGVKGDVLNAGKARTAAAHGDEKE